MIEFHAHSVELFAEEGLLTIHFDDGGERYLQLQAPEKDDPVEFEAGYGNVYVEVSDQCNSGFNCFSLAELTRDGFRIAFARDREMTAIGEVVAGFDIDDAAFAKLRRGLALAFRWFPGFRERG